MQSTHLSSWSTIILIYYLQKGAEVHEHVVLMCWIGMKSMYQCTYTRCLYTISLCIQNPTNTYLLYTIKSKVFNNCFKTQLFLYTLCKAMKPSVHTMPVHQVQAVRMQNHWHMTDGTQQVPCTETSSCFNHYDLYHYCLWPLSLL